MKSRRLFFFFLISSSFTAFKLVGQVNTTTTGGNAIGSGTISFSIGQTFYQYNSGTNGSLNEGSQQPYIVEPVTGIGEPILNLGVSVSPNPTTDYVHLKIDSVTTPVRNLINFQLTDLNGRLLQDGTSKTGEVDIFMGNLNKSVYFLRVAVHNGEIRTFRIVKK